jgi:acetyl esterase/lipase
MRGSTRFKVARRAGVAIAGVVLLAATASGCDWPPNTRYVDPVFANVDVTTNIPYRTTTTSTGAPITLYLDIYQPRGDTAAKRPAVMWEFGGYWVSGNKSNMATFATESARRGYVGVSIQYRLRGSTSEWYPAALDAYDDAVAAVQWLKDHAAEYRIDPNAIIAGGYSAGAVNSMNLVFMPPDRGPAETPVAGGIILAGLTFTAPRSGRPPVIMFGGTNDTTVTYATQVDNCNASKAAGNVCEFVSYPNTGHILSSAQRADAVVKAHHFIFDNVLLKKGYVAEQIPAAAAA